MKRLSHTEFVERVRQQHGNSMEILGEYTNKRTKLLVRHECGYSWLVNPASLYRGHGCPRCAKSLPKDTQQIKDEVFQAVGDEYLVLGEYINTHTPIRFRHQHCGTEFMMSPKSFLIQGQRCPKERYVKSANANRMPLNDILDQLKALVGSEYSIVGNYQGASKKATFLHRKCGRNFEMAPNRFLNGGSRCPLCYIDQNRSKGETVIADFLRQRGFLFEPEYQLPGCKNIRPLLFDFAVFRSAGMLKCLIEYDGSHHFSPKFPNAWVNYRRTRINDGIKDRYCEQHGIPLLRISYVRTTKSEVFETKIRTQLAQALANIS